MKGKTEENSHVSKNTHRVLTAIESGESGNFSYYWGYRAISSTIALSCSGVEESDEFANLAQQLGRSGLRVVFCHR
jgi:hypothetical protein